MISQIKTVYKALEDRKGQNLSIKTMAIMVLGIMVVVLIYGAFSGWFDTVANEFTSSMKYPDPTS